MKLVVSGKHVCNQLDEFLSILDIKFNIFHHFEVIRPFSHQTINV